ncbi:MAG: 3',5'-cyclic-AMP phosphodiesterase [Methyloprofundus sp.]|nr:MAG: 3',5'-cyclic-AMP phosphodiesterase [Methyloprofundus sp.]
MPNTSPALRLIQLTDLHLFADVKQQFKGCATHAALECCLDFIVNEDLRPDAFLLTGDLAHDHQAATYQRLADMLERFQVPSFALAGNHDDWSVMQSVYPNKGISIDPWQNIGGWRILLLHTAIPEQADGRIDPKLWAQLTAEMQQQPDKPYLLAMHHNLPAHPLRDIRSSVANAAQYSQALANWPAIRAVLSGHVHQPFTIYAGHCLFLSAPSTGVIPYPERVQDSMSRPGFRLIDCFADGRIISDIIHPVKR